VIVATFNDQYQALKTRITELEVALAAAIEAKRVAELAAQWEAQLALTNSALTTASNAVIEANSVLASTVEFPAKTTAVEASKQANAAFKFEIQCIANLNASLACLDASIAAVLAGKSTVLAKPLLASITALLAVVKAVLVNANCVSQDAARSAARLASIAATSVAPNALACLCKVSFVRSSECCFSDSDQCRGRC
jgi:cysteinyl-tRNA synthetase